MPKNEYFEIKSGCGGEGFGALGSYEEKWVREIYNHIEKYQKIHSKKPSNLTYVKVYYSASIVRWSFCHNHPHEIELLQCFY